MDAGRGTFFEGGTGITHFTCPNCGACAVPGEQFEVYGEATRTGGATGPVVTHLSTSACAHFFDSRTYEWHVIAHESVYGRAARLIVTARP